MKRDPIYGWILLPLAMLVLASLACGGFQLRSTATPKAGGRAAGQPTAVAKLAKSTVAPTIAAEAPITTPTPSATSTPNVPTGGLVVGKTARVTATGGINVRDKAGTSGKQVGKVGTGQTVTLRGGPVQADNFTWWQIDNGAGLTGWVSMGPANDPWLNPDSAAPAITPATGGGRLVDRPIKVGDIVQVTTLESRVLTIRDGAAKDANATAHVLPGTQFTVKGGPEDRDGITWWQLEGEEVSGWAAAGDGTDRWLTPVER
jgi:uncharacterized protein YgiM (DUF1202 family)